MNNYTENRAAFEQVSGQMAENRKIDKLLAEMQSINDKTSAMYKRREKQLKVLLGENYDEYMQYLIW